MQNIIKRDEYLNRIIDRKENGLIKVITGIRRCGKSFLLFNLFYDYLIESGVKEEKRMPQYTAKELKQAEILRREQQSERDQQKQRGGGAAGG